MNELDCRLRTDPERQHSSLRRLAKLHKALAVADKHWPSITRVTRKVEALSGEVERLWRDLPGDREPLLQATEKARLLMKIIRLVCATDKRWEHSFSLRTLLRDELDNLCIVIATYREEVSNG